MHSQCLVPVTSNTNLRHAFELVVQFISWGKSNSLGSALMGTSPMRAAKFSSWRIDVLVMKSIYNESTNTGGGLDRGTSIGTHIVACITHRTLGVLTRPANTEVESTPPPPPVLC